MKTLIGSSAIRHWFPDFNREPRDIDYAVDCEASNGPGEPVGGIRVEYLYNPIIFKYSEESVAAPDLLLTLKVAHLPRHPEQFDKTCWDIQFLLNKGYTINQGIFQEFYNFFDDYLGVIRRSDLDMEAKDFFDNSVNSSEVPHDFIHTLIKDPPTYKKTLMEGQEVQTEESKFWGLTHSEKCDLIYEEIEVMAVERFKGLSYRSRYSKMLKKFVMGHAPIYMIPFIAENWKTLHKARHDFMTIINTGLVKAGKRELL